MTPEQTTRRRVFGWLVVIALYFAVQLAPRPAAIRPEGWRLLGIFIATIGGLIALLLRRRIGRVSLRGWIDGFAHPCHSDACVMLSRTQPNCPLVTVALQ